MRLLLDTHSFLWWIEDDPSLGSAARAAIDVPTNPVYVSAVSAWEIAIKRSKGTLEAPRGDVGTWIAQEGFAELEIAVRHATAAGALPLHHRDPFDRMLVTARGHDARDFRRRLDRLRRSNHPRGSMKSGFVAVAGRPNVGKSTLVNALVGEKIAITSRVPNTTRRRIYGVANGEDYQLVLADLPGFQRPMDKLTERMQSTVDTSFADIDVVLFVMSARERIGAGDRFIARRVYALGIPVIVALNKVDNLKPSHIVTGMKAAAALGDFHALHPVSALTKDGVDELRGDLIHLLPEGRPFFERESATDQTAVQRIAELIREKALQLTRDEVPHSISVEVDELDHKLLRAFVLVETDSQKQILVGKKGAMIREIGTRARPEIEQLLGRRIFLELKVKVRARWRRDDAQLDRFGL